LISFKENDDVIVKIIDFGFATAVEKAELHCGTPNFMAPELLEKSVRYCPLKVDIWALGVTLFYLCEGRYPFKGYDEKELFKCIRMGNYELKKCGGGLVREIIGKMLKVKPG
jgi:serine/threonine protein kinase